MTRSGANDQSAASRLEDDQPLGKTDRADIAAFYLPQFHPIPENDRWWGEGFTEWTNVRRSLPFFEGHRQPQLPGPLGYYNLLDPEVHYRQQELAQTYGVTAFCYYTYWFRGRRLLEKPLDIVLREPLPLKYFLCWANENWTRTWDGLEEEILVEQCHDPETDVRIIDDLAPHLANDRYLRINNRPVLVIYRASLMHEPARTADLLRQRAAELGLGDLHLAMVQSFDNWDPRIVGFDSAVELPPHNLGSNLFRVVDADPEAPKVFEPETWAGGIYSYPRVVEWSMSKNVPEFRWFRGIMPGWDNTPRRLERASAFVGDNPDLFQSWAERALHYTYLFNPPSEWLLFVNSWNEWGEGAYLEPDFEFRSQRLEALAGALANTDPLATSVKRFWESEGPVSGDLLETARAYFRSSAILGREALSLWFST